MVTGIESFKEWFKGNESQYAIIGGTACDILMTEEGLDFRATKDIDLVLIIEAVDAAFGRKFWDYVKQAGYEHCNKSSGMPQFYRFSHPMSNRYPAMIELFTRKLDAIQLPDDAVLTPLPMDEDISSLSAILLDDDYYEFLKQGKVTVDGVTVEKEVPSNPQKAEYLIPIFIGELLEQGKMSVKVLKTNDTWYGMTYHEDVAAVKDSFKKMLADGVYKADLFADL